jgi:hypothetical protein
MRAPHFRLRNRLHATGGGRAVRDYDHVFTAATATASSANADVDSPLRRPAPQLALDGGSSNP